jgi:hypothetical protein
VLPNNTPSVSTQPQVMGFAEIELTFSIWIPYPEAITHEREPFKF